MSPQGSGGHFLCVQGYLCQGYKLVVSGHFMAGLVSKRVVRVQFMSGLLSEGVVGGYFMTGSVSNWDPV